MTTVTVSPKYQIVNPRKVRDQFHLTPGQKVQIMSYNNRIEIIQERKISEMRGFIDGIDPTFNR